MIKLRRSLFETYCNFRSVFTQKQLREALYKAVKENATISIEWNIAYLLYKWSQE